MSGYGDLLASGVELGPACAREIEDRLAALRAPLAEQVPSDGTYSNFWLFQGPHRYAYHPGPWPCISGRTYDGCDVLVPLFDLAAAPMPVLRALQGDAAWFYPVAQATSRHFGADAVERRVVRDDSDYLYRAEAFLDYEGAGLGGKRQKVARLLAAHAVSVQPLRADAREPALAVLDGWCADKGRTREDADAPACRVALEELAEGGPLSGFLHSIGGVPAGFVLIEWLNPGVAAVRFAKGRLAYDGIFAYLFQDLARRLCPGLEWLNFEQDLGIQNFRRTKLSFRPATLIDKIRLRVRAG